MGAIVAMAGLATLGAMEESQQRQLLHHIADDVCGKPPDYGADYGVAPGNSKFEGCVAAYKHLMLAAAGDDGVDVSTTPGLPEGSGPILKEVVAARLPDLRAASHDRAAHVA